MKKIQICCLMLVMGVSLVAFARQDKGVQFETATPLWQSAENFTTGDVCLGDPNGDGLLDLGLATYNGGYPPMPEEERVFFNLGTLFETTPSWVGTEAAWSTSCLFAQMFDQNRTDFVVSNGGASQSPPAIYRVRDAGLETTPRWHTDNSFAGSGLGIAVGDVNQDGKLDLFVAYQCMSPCTGAPVAGYFSSGNTIGAVPDWTSSARLQFSSVALADIDRSGVETATLVVVGDGVRRVFWAPHTPVHAFLRVLVDQNSPGFVSTDLRSGYVVLASPPPAGAQVEILYEYSQELDLAASGNPGGLMVFSHNGQSLNDTPDWTADAQGGYREVAFVDLDLDGYLDLIAGGASSPCAVYSNNQGVLSDVPSWTSQEADCSVEDLAVMDANADGYPDLVTTSFTEATIVHIYVNNQGTLEATPSFTIPWGGEACNAVTAFDADGDGMDDLVVGYSQSPVRLYRNLGQPLGSPVIDSVDPVNLPADQPATITMVGQNFNAPLKVFVGNTILETIDVTSTSITATVPAFLPMGESRRVAVVNTDLQAAAWCCLQKNEMPYVDAGPDRSISISSSTINLNGVVTDDGLPNPPAQVVATWSQESGPDTVVFADVHAPGSSATFPAQGDYGLRLTADDGELQASDVIQVKVGPPNVAPVVAAGSDMSIYSNQAAALSGSASDDGLPNPPGSMVFVWSKQSGPGDVVFTDAAAAITTATFSAAGTYLLRLTANDGELEGYDEVEVIVILFNEPPVVNAGPNQNATIFMAEKVTLSGTVTDDGVPNPPGQVTSLWSMNSGPGLATFVDASVPATQVSLSMPGTYELRLSASDSEKQASDVVTIHVHFKNAAPTVNAGPDQVVSLSTGATLAASATDDGLPDPPGSVVLSWSKQSGPGNVVFDDAAAASTTVTFSEMGTYLLRLTVNDGELEGDDDVEIVVTSNQAPVVDAGPNQNVNIFPMESIDLAGTVSDDGIPNPPGQVNTLWSKVSGPGTVSFVIAAAPVTKASFDLQGIYELRLAANDGELDVSDTVVIEVHFKNKAPIVNAGPDQTVTLSSGANLTGTASDDSLPDPPSTVTYQWEQISGSGTATFVNETALATSVTFSEAGTYVLRLTADDGELEAKDEVTITVTEEDTTEGGGCGCASSTPGQGPWVFLGLLLSLCLVKRRARNKGKF